MDRVAVPKGASPVRTVLTVLMDLLIVAAIVGLAALIIAFFGQLMAQPGMRQGYSLAVKVVLPFGIKSIPTPYGGIFDLDAVASIVLYVVLEWIVGMVRRSR